MSRILLSLKPLPEQELRRQAHAFPLRPSADSTDDAVLLVLVVVVAAAVVVAIVVLVAVAVVTRVLGLLRIV